MSCRTFRVYGLRGGGGPYTCIPLSAIAPRTAQVLMKKPFNPEIAWTPALLITLGLSVALPAGASAAQETALPRFDVDRAWLSDTTVFRPFLVEETVPLREARQDGAVDNDTGILVVRGDHGVLALITREMAYHHVAQGELDGEPWMVSF